MKKRIFLTSEEIHRLARAALDRGYASGDDDIVRKLRQLQKIVLPEDRQRNIHTRVEITGRPERPNILDTMDVLAANGYKPKVVILPTDIQHDVHLVEANEVAHSNGHSVEIPTDAAPEPEAPSQFSATIDGFLRTCAKQVVEQFMEYLRDELAGAIQKELPAILPALKEAKIIRQKILIIGLKPQQAGMIVQEFGTSYDLRFVDSGRSASAADGKLNVDRIIGMTNFMSHAAEDHIKKHPGYKRVSGGMDSLREELRSIQ